MKCRVNIFLRKSINAKFILSIISMIMINWSFVSRAQKSEFFTTNGRNVNIESFNQEVIRMMGEVKVPGMSLAIIDNNEIVFYNTYGVKKRGDKKKVNKKTVFSGASLSKSLLVYVAHQLVDEGKLDLDRPMYQYLEYERLAHDTRYKLITPRMVLSHSSGMENWETYNAPDTLEILTNPGEKFVYSGEGYHYLAKVIELILDQSYDEYINERVIKPLELKNTYLKFKQKNLNPFHKGSPWNYAFGHRVFDGYTRGKNTRTVPAAGNHFTAEDYAKLVLAIFDTTYLSVNRINDLLEPIARMGTTSVYYGPGFEVNHSNGDIIIAHGGDNPGYKNLMFYSVVNKRGFVFMTNSDRGKMMAAKICKMSVGLNIDPFLESLFVLFEQYPSNAISLLKIYDEKGLDAMFSGLEKLKSERKISVNTLNLLSHFFYRGGHEKVSMKLLEDNVTLFPYSPLAYSLLGDAYLQKNELDSAFKYIKKAKELNHRLWDIEMDLKEYEKRLAEFNKRKTFSSTINANELTTVQAENYCAMNGIKTYKRTVSWIGEGDWMDYKLNVTAAGTYSVAFRVASLPGGGQFQLKSGTKLLATIDVTSTNGWENWAIVKTNVDLSSGDQVLRLYVSGQGSFDIDWLQFSAIASTED